MMIYFHGNAEDLGLSFEILDLLRSVLKIHVLGVEYPGYGVYEGRASSDVLLNDSECVYSFLISLGILPENIMVFGRSIGSGPATYLARSRKICCLMLMSAYTSIKQATKDLAGTLAKSLIKERFENDKNMEFIMCPTFIVHGVMDKVIPFSHSQSLHELCKGPSSLFLPSKMTHNSFDYCNDLIIPIANFLNQTGIYTEPQDGKGTVFVPWSYLQAPPRQKIKGMRRVKDRNHTSV